MPRRSTTPVLAAALLAFGAVTLTGCLTPKANDRPSAAVLEARKGAGQKAQPCQATQLDDVSPASATFPFDDSLLDEMGGQRLAKVTAFLACHPQTPVVVIPGSDNHGDAAHQNDLAGRRAQAVTAALRAGGATTSVIRIVQRGGADPLSGPHVLIRAEGRGW